MITHEEPGAALRPTHSLALAMGPGGVPFAPPILGGLVATVSRERAEHTVLAPLGPLAKPPAFEAAGLALYPLLAQIDLALKDESSAEAFPFVPMGYALVWRLQTRWNREGPGSRDAEYLVDAHSGALLRERPLASRLGVGHTLFNGEVKLGTTPRPGGGFELRDPDRGLGGNTVRHITSREESKGVRSTSYAVYGQEGNEVWGNGLPDDEATIAASAAYALQSSWDYFSQVHGRNGPDGKGTAVTVTINDPEEVDGAMWQSGTKGEFGRMVIGKAEAFLPAVDLDTFGHELAHGVTRNTAGLNEGLESRGLDEAGSDLFGQMVETWTRSGGGNPKSGMTPTAIGDAGTRWLVQSHQKEPKGGITSIVDRNLFEPSLVPMHPEAWSPDLYLMADEHHQSSPMGRAFYFLSRGAADPRSATPPHPRSPRLSDPHYSALLPSGMAGIGNNQTAQLWYQALTTELQPMSDYRDARRAMLKAADTLYGDASPQAEAVTHAFGAINVGKPGHRIEPNAAWTTDLEPRVQMDETDVLLSVAMPDPTQARSIAFLVDGIPQGKRTAPFGPGPVTLRLPAVRGLRNGDHSFMALVRDLEDQVVATRPLPFTQNLPVEQLLRDPGLEHATTWPSNSPFVLKHVGELAHGGERCAEFSLGAQIRDPRITQFVDLPTGPRQLLLSYWIWTQPGTAPGVDDALRLSVVTPPDEPTATPFETAFTPASAADGWVRHTADLSRFAGGRVRIRFQSNLGEGSTTVFRLDDITLVSNEPPPGP
jgi:Zn-dependent metalloprotease